MAEHDVTPDTAIIGLNAVIVAVTEDETPRALIVRRVRHALATPALKGQSPGGPAQSGQKAGVADTPDALPFGPFDPSRDRTLEGALRAWVEDQTGLVLGYVEQLYTFGDRYRDPRERAGGPRVVSVGYLNLVREAALSGTGDAEWRDWYAFFPWEDWRNGRPRLIDQVIAPGLAAWAKAPAGEAAVGAKAPAGEAAAARADRANSLFGLERAAWDFERVLERYELLYEAGLVAEAARDKGKTPDAALAALGKPLALDHRRILATALGRLRGKLKYRPVVFELLAPEFTLTRLQRVVEAFAGVRLHKQNFRRLVVKGGLVESTGRFERPAGEERRRGRPAELFRFRREVSHERLAPGVGLPAIKAGRAVAKSAKAGAPAKARR
jgi:hypothetical protein